MKFCGFGLDEDMIIFRKIIVMTHSKDIQLFNTNF
jgi:hypothetical protein